MKITLLGALSFLAIAILFVCVGYELRRDSEKKKPLAAVNPSSRPVNS